MMVLSMRVAFSCGRCLPFVSFFFFFSFSFFFLSLFSIAMLQPTAEELDAELEKYAMANEERAKDYLDAQLEEYNRKR